MDSLKEKILEEGTAIGSDIVKVDRFLNHKLDVRFLEAIGKEFHNLFKSCNVTLILTAESGGIAVAAATSKFFGYVPVIFAKKAKPSTMTDGYYAAEAKSFTKGTRSTFIVSKEFIHAGDNVLIIDDFMAHGEAATALCELVSQAGGKVCGIGAVIEKRYQGGYAKLTGAGYRVESLACIEKIVDGEIIFID